MVRPLELRSLPFKSGHSGVISNSKVKELLDITLGTNYRIIGVGGNANLPGSRYQPAHFDEFRGSEFIIINIPLEKTIEYNGSTEVWPGTHRENLTFSLFNTVPRTSVRLNSMSGDVILRHSKLWHRGTPNNSKDVRVMLGILVARPDQTLPPFTVSEDEKARLQSSGFPLNTIVGSNLNRGFVPNYFPTNLKGNVLELTWMYTPRLYAELRRFKKHSI